jgi:hypothetical protein
MMTRHRALARSFPSFGRRVLAGEQHDAAAPAGGLSDDLRLFALTFAGGFLFMSVYLA